MAGEAIYSRSSRRRSDSDVAAQQQTAMAANCIMTPDGISATRIDLATRPVWPYHWCDAVLTRVQPRTNNVILTNYRSIVSKHCYWDLTTEYSDSQYRLVAPKWSDRS